MKWIILPAVALLSACGQTAQERESEQLLTKMGLFDKNKNYGGGIPDYPIKCTFEARGYCVGGECQSLKSEGPPMYVEIDTKAKTYKRCGPKVGDCGTHLIVSIEKSGEYRNVVVNGGTLFKYGPSGRFTDIVTQGSQTFVSDGKCVRTD